MLVVVTTDIILWFDNNEQPQNMMHNQSQVYTCTHTRKLQPVELLAALHGITLPKECDLPATYSLRKWLTRRLATLNGRHKAVWQSIKVDPKMPYESERATS